MFVNGVQNIAFRYNPIYHNKVDSKLTENKSSFLPNKMAELDKFANQIEDKILYFEAKGDKYTNCEEYRELTYLLNKVRMENAFYLSKSYPDLKYPDKLIEQYSDEISKSDTNFKKYWRKDLCNSLSKYSVKYQRQPMPFEDTDEYKRRVELPNYLKNNKNPLTFVESSSNSAPPVAKQPVINESFRFEALDDEFKLLEKYVPSASDPKGFRDVFGMEDIKQQLNDEIIDYLRNPQLKQLDYEEYGITPPSTFLFYGPPGCGKTYVAQALASEAQVPMYCMDLSKIGSALVNKTANNIEEAFDFLREKTQRTNQPVILFMDEVDSLAISRDKVNDSSENSKATTTLLKQIQQAKDNNIIVIAATNKYNNLDNAFISRFEKQTQFSLFNEEQIYTLVKSILERKTKGKNLSEDDESLKKISKQLVGYSNRTISFIINEAAKNARNNNRSDITYMSFIKAINESDFDKIDGVMYTKDDSRKPVIVTGFTPCV